MAGVRVIPLALAVAAATPARANVFEVFGAGARSNAMAGTVTATASDASAVWHNPAGLADAENGIGMGLVGSFDRTTILLSPRPRGYDPPGYGLRLEPRRDSGDQGRIFGVSLGLTLRLLSDDLHAGALIYFPSAGFAHASGFLTDERQQYFDNQLRFELLGERLRSEIIAFGLSYRLADWLSLGLGLKAQEVSKTESRVYTPNAADPANVYMATSLEQGTDTALIAGAILRPWPFLRVGLTFHDEIAFDLHGRSVVQINGQENEDDYPVVQPIRQVEHASVPRLGTGVAYTGERWNVGVDAAWMLWSRYQGPSGDPAGLDDTYTLTSGVEYEMRRGTRLRGGVGWHPSPVPAQTGRTNFVDNDRLVASLGAGDRFEVWDQRFEADLGLQLHILLARETTKRLPASPRGCGTDTTSLCDEVADSSVDTPVLPAAATQGLQTGNPGFPGFGSGGYMVTAGVDVRWLF